MFSRHATNPAKMTREDYMNKLEFFKEATLHISASPDPEVGIGHFFQFLKQSIPLQGMTFHVYDPGLLALRLFRLRFDETALEFDKIIPVEGEVAQKLAKWSYPDRVHRIDRSSEDPVSRTLLESLSKHVGTGEKSCIVALLDLGSDLWGHCCFFADGADRFSDEHVSLIEMLIPPLSIATRVQIKFDQVLRLKSALAEENQFLHDELKRFSGEEIIGSDSGLKDIMDMTAQLARVNTPVLINGETGVGKELIANAIQSASARHDRTFVKVNCGAIPDSLLDSELFGHEKGAFTGAQSRKIGRFERASGGTIFLDEIGELPLKAQTRLLRVLQNHEIERVGGVKALPVDIRVIAATHRDLPEMVKRGEFREDLFFRLNVFPLIVPPLRHRKQDIPALTLHFCKKIAASMKLAGGPKLMPGAMESLMAYDWPGNVRELENLVERALILFPQGPLRFDSLFPKAFGQADSVLQESEEILPLDIVIQQHIQRALRETQGRVSGPNGAAKLLQINPNTLRKRMDKLGISYKLQERKHRA